jgi:hypothetical protein
MSALSVLPRPRGFARLSRRFAAAPWSTLAELAARAGYAARGAVYVSIGFIALLASAGLTPKAQGALGALYAWGQWPAGIALLWLIGTGLYGFAGWRALQALFDADQLGREPKALFTRAGQAISGLVYGGLAISVFGLLDAIEDLHEADDQAATSAAVAQALDLPAGGLLVIGVGLFILGAGLGSMIRAVVGHFGRTLTGGDETRRWAGVLARSGYFARGLAFLPAGFFTVRAGWHARASEARGVGGALEAMKGQPFGEMALALVALGFIAFGLFAFMEALRRPIDPGQALKT